MSTKTLTLTFLMLATALPLAAQPQTATAESQRAVESLGLDEELAWRSAQGSALSVLVDAEEGDAVPSSTSLGEDRVRKPLRPLGLRGAGRSSARRTLDDGHRIAFAHGAPNLDPRRAN